MSINCSKGIAINNVSSNYHKTGFHQLHVAITLLHVTLTDSGSFSTSPDKMLITIVIVVKRKKSTLLTLVEHSILYRRLLEYQELLYLLFVNLSKPPEYTNSLNEHSSFSKSLMTGSTLFWADIFNDSQHV